MAAAKPEEETRGVAEIAGPGHPMIRPQPLSAAAPPGEGKNQTGTH